MAETGARATNRAQSDRQKTEWHHQRQDPVGYSEGEDLPDRSLGHYKLKTGPTQAGGDGCSQSTAEDADRGGPSGRHEGIGRRPQQAVPGGGQGRSQERDPKGQLLDKDNGARYSAHTGQARGHGDQGK